MTLMTLSVDSLRLERVERLPDHDGSFIIEFRTKGVQQRDGILIQPDLHRQPPVWSVTPIFVWVNESRHRDNLGTFDYEGRDS